MAAKRKRRYTLLTTQDVKDIKRMLIKGYTLSSIAEEFGTALATISWIADGGTWEEVSVRGWDDFLEERLELKRKRRKPINLQRKKKTIKSKAKKKTIKVNAKKKTVKIQKRKPKQVTLKKSEKVLKGAPKRPDHDKWSEQFEKGKNKNGKLVTIPVVTKRRKKAVATTAETSEATTAEG